MLISEQTFNNVFPRAKEGIYQAISAQMEKAGCKTKDQQAMFLAQCGHETGGFRLFVENLNYRAEALLRTFPRHFNASNVKQYAGNPEKIANKAYANRMGNGDEASGHGWKYRGRGLIQITGRANYIAFERWLGRDITADQVGTDLDLIVLAGVWYWQALKLANVLGIEAVTRKINGGTHGIVERAKYYETLRNG